MLHLTLFHTFFTWDLKVPPLPTPDFLYRHSPNVSLLGDQACTDTSLFKPLGQTCACEKWTSSAWRMSQTTACLMFMCSVCVNVVFLRWNPRRKQVVLLYSFVSDETGHILEMYVVGVLYRWNGMETSFHCCPLGIEVAKSMLWHPRYLMLNSVP